MAKIGDMTLDMNTQAACLLQLLSSIDVDLPRGMYVSTHPYMNCRERGFIILIKPHGRKPTKVAFYEHRNSDQLCALMDHTDGNVSSGYGPSDFPGFGNKWDVTESWPYMQIHEAAAWLTEIIEDEAKLSKSLETKVPA